MIDNAKLETRITGKGGHCENNKTALSRQQAQQQITRYNVNSRNGKADAIA